MAEDTFAERLWEGIDEALAPYDVPSEFGEILKSDLKAAFDIKAKPRPGYEPGAVAFVRFNLIDAITQPGKTAWRTISSVFGNLSRPSVPLLWTDAEDAVWEHYFTTAGFDPRGGPTVPLSLQQAVLRWNERARLRVTRLIAEEKGILQSPGLTLMMARELREYYIASGARVPVGLAPDRIIAQAEGFERDIAHCLAIGDWAGADEIQRAWFKASKAYRDPLRKEFERAARLGQSGVSSAAQQLATSPEGAFWQYWRNRNLYFITLNFLNTYREGGFWGVVKGYIWMEFTKRAFAAGTWRYYLYPKNLISGAVGWTAERVRLTALLNKLTDAKAWFARTWKRFVATPLKKGFEFVRDRIIRKAVGWLITKLGLRVLITKIGALIGGAIGTVAPGIGNAIGAVLGAFVSFIGGIIGEKMMKPVLQGTVYLFAGSCGCLALAIGGAAIGLPLLMASIFAPGAGGGVVPPLPPAAQVTVKKESCVKKIIFHEEEWICKTSSPIGNNTGEHEIQWLITVHNGSDQTAEVTVSDTECGQTWTYTLSPGQSNVPGCTRSYDTNNPALHNTTVYNTVTGTATVGGDSRDLYAMGMLVIGTPPDAPPCGYPAGKAMTITSLFMATDACRPYDLLCGTAPMEGCGDDNATGLHSGLDLVVAGTEEQDGQELYSTINGTVMYIHQGSGSDWAYITVCNTRWCILYGHTYRAFPVSVGDTVTVGQHIAWLDDTGYSFGPHVHYMVWDDPAIFTWGNFSDCAPNCCSSPLHNPANFLGACD